MDERRYGEDEAAEIFRRAAELEQRDPATVVARQGMTLAELQEIGREAGLAPHLVARAATTGGREAVTMRRLLGIPVAVGRTVELHRVMDDAEWERLVVDLRETFAARGKLRVDGALRQWSNGNLQVLVEPVETGHRIRLRTLNESAQFMLGGGAAMLGIAALLGIMDVATAGVEVGAALQRMGGLAAAGATIFAWGAVRVPGWARLRRRQMDEVADRMVVRKIDAQ